MRSLWMASAALLMTGGVALAQTNSMSSGASSPAPTGAVNAPVESQPGQPPGNMAPNNMAPGDQSSSSMSSSGMANTNAAPGSSSGMMQSTHPWAHHDEMPANAGPRAYLHMAQHAIEHHDKMRAESALGHAETRLLTRSVDAGSSMSSDQSPAVKAIEDARNALSSGDYSTAAQDTSNALQQVESHNNMPSDNSMSSGNGMSPNNGTFSDNAMSNDGDNDSETGSMAPSVNSTSRSGDMSQGGGVTHDSATPSVGAASGNGMSTGMVNGNGVPPAPSVSSMSRSGQGLGQ